MRKRTSITLSQDTDEKLNELAALFGVSRTEIINNLIQSEHRYRRADIARIKAQIEEIKARGE